MSIRLALAVLICVAAIAIGVVTEVQGFDMTQGQKVAAFWPRYLCVMGMTLAVMAILRGKD